ncbi:Tyrosine-protein phosphatase non-receptor type 2 [Chytridiales sp. JEL 0842]|nr:Tyrosine-protein phosphatase non-receptor type 2 [Chytridiales sp. JEL 0842]
MGDDEATPTMTMMTMMMHNEEAASAASSASTSTSSATPLPPPPPPTPASAPTNTIPEDRNNFINSTASSIFNAAVAITGSIPIVGPYAATTAHSIADRISSTVSSSSSSSSSIATTPLASTTTLLFSNPKATVSQVNNWGYAHDSSLPRSINPSKNEMEILSRSESAEVGMSTSIGVVSNQQRDVLATRVPSSNNTSTSLSSSSTSASTSASSMVSHTPTASDTPFKPSSLSSPSNISSSSPSATPTTPPASSIPPTSSTATSTFSSLSPKIPSISETVSSLSPKLPSISDTVNSVREGVSATLTYGRSLASSAVDVITLKSHSPVVPSSNLSAGAPSTMSSAAGTSSLSSASSSGASTPNKPPLTPKGAALPRGPAIPRPPPANTTSSQPSKRRPNAPGSLSPASSTSAPSQPSQPPTPPSLIEITSDYLADLLRRSRPPTNTTTPSNLMDSNTSTPSTTALSTVPSSASTSPHTSPPASPTANPPTPAAGKESTPGPDHQQRVLLLDVRSYVNYAHARVSSAVNLCVPSTLLRRAAFGVDKLLETLGSEQGRGYLREALRMHGGSGDSTPVRGGTSGSSTPVVGGGGGRETPQAVHVPVQHLPSLGKVSGVGASTGFSTPLEPASPYTSHFTSPHPSRPPSPPPPPLPQSQQQTSSSSSIPTPSDRSDVNPPPLLNPTSDLPYDHIVLYDHNSSSLPSSIALLGAKFANLGIGTAGSKGRIGWLKGGFEEFRERYGEFCEVVVAEQGQMQQGNSLSFASSAVGENKKKEEEDDEEEEGVGFEVEGEGVPAFLKGLEVGKKGWKREWRRSWETLQMEERERLGMASKAREPTDPFCVSVGLEGGVKNRYGNVWPFNFNRVRLPTWYHPTDDYINASHLTPPTACPHFRRAVLHYAQTDSEKRQLASRLNRLGKRTYIATQEPLESTRAAFWCMTFSQDVSIILMLTDETRQKPPPPPSSSTTTPSNGGFTYFPTQPTQPTMQVGMFHLRLLTSRRVRTSVYLRSLLVTRLDTGESKVVAHVTYTRWTDGGGVDAVGAGGLWSLLESLRGSLGSEEGKVVVHCSAGCGRTGSWVVLEGVLGVWVGGLGGWKGGKKGKDGEKEVEEENVVEEMDVSTLCSICPTPSSSSSSTTTTPPNPLFHALSHLRSQRISTPQTLSQYLSLIQILGTLSTLTPNSEKWIEVYKPRRSLAAAREVGALKAKGVSARSRNFSSSSVLVQASPVSGGVGNGSEGSRTPSTEEVLGLKVYEQANSSKDGEEDGGAEEEEHEEEEEEEEVDGKSEHWEGLMPLEPETPGVDGRIRV